jgi:hypothetical protein
LKCMDIDIEPAWVTAMATVVLVVVTTVYIILSWRIVQQPRKQAEEREEEQMRDAIYEPLFRNLENILDSLKEDPLCEPDFRLEILRRGNPYFYSLVSHYFAEELEKFSLECEIYRRSVQFARKKINDHLLDAVRKLSKERIASFEKESNIYVCIGSNRRHIFTFIFEREHPKKWIEKEKENFAITPPVETLIYVNIQTENTLKPKNIASSPEIFFSFYEIVQEEISKDYELMAYINKWKTLIDRANLLKEETRRLLQ